MLFKTGARWVVTFPNHNFKSVGEPDYPLRGPWWASRFWSLRGPSWWACRFWFVSWGTECPLWSFVRSWNSSLHHQYSATFSMLSNTRAYCWASRFICWGATCQNCRVSVVSQCNLSFHQHQYPTSHISNANVKELWRFLAEMMTAEKYISTQDNLENRF